MLTPNNKAWERIPIGFHEMGDIIKRHIFTGLLFCDVIAKKTFVVSLDLKPFEVEV
jgi:hypothetical protein